MRFEPKALKQNFRETLQDSDLRTNLLAASTHALEARAELSDADPLAWEALCDRVAAVRRQGLLQNEQLLTRFSRQVEERGGTVLRAKTAEEARRQVLDIVRRHDGDLVVKGKSMVSEEIELSDYLNVQGVETWETDLGEFIVQLAHEKPVHIIAPVMHKNRRQIGRLLERELDIPYSDDPAVLTRHARAFLRRKFLDARIGISGANFMLADTGQIVLVENEGNIRLSSLLPEVHIALTGIEKILPSAESLPDILQALSASATGQKMAGYITVLGGTARPGPEHFYVVILDGGRQKMLAGPSWEMLSCIRCGACLNICPIYHRGGGHAYGSIYPGPMGSVLTPHLTRPEAAPHHPFACSVCGKCGEICPAQIPLPALLLRTRQQVAQAKGMSIERIFWQIWAFFMQHPTLLRLGRRLLRALPFRLRWGIRTRKLPRLAARTFLENRS